MSHRENADTVIVGGGLVGALLATILADRGYRVTVFEWRPDMRRVTGSAGRSINLVLTRRGIRALAKVGLDREALALTVPVTGRMMHSPSGELAYQPYGKDDSECNFSIPRGGLNRFLIDAAESRGVEFRFGAKLVGADPGAGLLRFEDEAGTGERFDVEAAVVFGADGSGSAVRAAFAAGAGFEHSLETLSHGYKELEIPATDEGGFRIEERALHIWPRGDFMLMALPNRDGSFTVTLYLPVEGEQGFNRLTDADSVLALFREHFADSVPLIPNLATSFFENPTGSLATVRCGPWHLASRALLIGDAAHGIVPFFGQGMNTGFEDCTVLCELLDRHGEGNWREVFPEFSRRRKPNGDAIADMALENFVEMRDRVGDAGFLLRKQVEHRLEETMPLEYRSRYSMVMYSHIPFRLARQAGEIQQGILDELCAGLSEAAGVDLEHARALVAERLTPFLERERISLDY